MPNHVTTIVSIGLRLDQDEMNYDVEKERLVKLYKKLRTKESAFDFNAVVPQPKGIYRGNLSLEDHKKHPVNWYDWNIPNWGTKWNAYNVHYLDDYKDGERIYGELLVKFETAWNVPIPILYKLAEKFNIEFTWNDEGEGVWHAWEKINNTGQLEGALR